MKGVKSTLVLQQHGASGRAKCRKCKRTIEKGPRVCEYAYVSSPRVVFKRFLHTHCVPGDLRASVLEGAR
jgi:NAD-dependent SIR2 family protein deacetylase